MSSTFEAALERALPDYRVRPGPASVTLLARYLELVAAGNTRLRLVGDAEAEVLARRHVGESLFLGSLIQLDAQRLLDLGSGAGFPGLALALAFPGLITTLVESNGKKAEFLRQTVEALGVEGRVQVQQSFMERRRGAAPLAADLVTVRALEHMEKAPGWLGTWLRPGARAAFWVTRAMAETWKRRYSRWEWGELRLLPGAHSRGIIISVPRETLPR